MLSSQPAHGRDENSFRKPLAREVQGQATAPQVSCAGVKDELKGIAIKSSHYLAQLSARHLRIDLPTMHRHLDVR